MAYGQNINTPNFSNSFGQSPAERWRYSTINDMLMSIGQPGIDYNDSIMDTMEGQQALRILTDTMYEVEALGWEFNRYEDIEIELDDYGTYQFGTTGYIPGDSTYVFSLVGQSGVTLFVNQEGKIYDKAKPYDKFTIGKPFEKITLSQIIVEDWVSMPYALSLYVAALAVNRYQALIIGDASAARFTREDIDKKYVDARRGEPTSGKYNILTSPFGQSVARG